MNIFKFSQVPNKGFTLIELLVVIAIIGIISSIVYVSFSQARAQSRDDIRKSELKQLQLAIELYKAQNGVYPDGGCGMHDNGNAWVAPGTYTTGASYGDGTGGTESNCEEYIEGLVPDYIPALPVNQSGDLDNRGLRYAVNIAGDNYKLMNAGVEAKMVYDPDENFSRCPSSCFGSSDYDGYCTGSSYEHQTHIYTVYSAGAQCW